MEDGPGRIDTAQKINNIELYPRELLKGHAYIKELARLCAHKKTMADERGLLPLVEERKPSHE